MLNGIEGKEVNSEKQIRIRTQKQRSTAAKHHGLDTAKKGLPRPTAERIKKNNPDFSEENIVEFYQSYDKHCGTPNEMKLRGHRNLGYLYQLQKRDTSDETFYKKNPESTAKELKAFHEGIAKAKSRARRTKKGDEQELNENNDIGIQKTAKLLMKFKKKLKGTGNLATFQENSVPIDNAIALGGEGEKLPSQDNRIQPSSLLPAFNRAKTLDVTSVVNLDYTSSSAVKPKGKVNKPS